MRTRQLLSFLPFSLFFLVKPAYASDVDLMDIPTNLAEALGVTTFIAGIMAGSILLMIMILPTALITRKKNLGFIPELIMGFIGITISCALGWFPYWILIVLSLLIALMFAGNMRGWITGGKTS